MAQTLTEALIESVIARLQAEYGKQLDVAWYPQEPMNFHLAHPVGAVLVGYAKSQFGGDQATDATWVERQLTLPLTLVFCQLNGSHGVIAWLDRLRETLTGFMPTHCDAPLRPISEYFIGYTPGIWQYGQEWATRTVQVQKIDPAFGIPFAPHFGAPLQAPHFNEEF